MTPQRYAVWQNLFIDEVTENGVLLSVHLRDEAGRRNLVNYRFRDRVERLLQRDILVGWQATMTPLTYVRNGRQGVLVDDEAAFWQAFTWSR